MRLPPWILMLMTVLNVLFAAACDSRATTTARLFPLFGPVTNKDIISGHVMDDRGRAWLMVGGSRLLWIDDERRTYEAVSIPVPPHEDCWGLARLSDGSLWTLLGWNIAAQLATDGSIERSVELSVAHLGLFGAGDRLVFQRASLPSNTPALFSGRPDDADTARVPWSTLRARPFDALASGAAAALNLVACGLSQRAEVPCWFPDEPVVSLVAPDGRTSRVELAGLPRVAPETLINARVPRRPIRDVYVEADGTIWVISTGVAPEHSPNVPGGWLLARYSLRGEPIDRRVMPEPVRLILRADRGRAVVLTGSGMVSEVRP